MALLKLTFLLALLFFTSVVDSYSGKSLFDDAELESSSPDSSPSIRKLSKSFTVLKPDYENARGSSGRSYEANSSPNFSPNLNSPLTQTKQQTYFSQLDDSQFSDEESLFDMEEETPTAVVGLVPTVVVNNFNDKSNFGSSYSSNQRDQPDEDPSKDVHIHVKQTPQTQAAPAQFQVQFFNDYGKSKSYSPSSSSNSPSLFDEQSDFAPPAPPAPPVRPSPSPSKYSKQRPPIQSSSLFDQNAQGPQPPAPPTNFEAAPPSGPSSADYSSPQSPISPSQAAPTAYVQSNGQVNQISLTWAQLQAMLTPSTDIASVLSTITNAGNQGNGYRGGNGGTPLPPSPPVGPPSPPPLPAPPAPPVPQPPSPPFGAPALAHGSQSAPPQSAPSGYGSSPLPVTSASAPQAPSYSFQAPQGPPIQASAPQAAAPTIIIVTPNGQNDAIFSNYGYQQAPSSAPSNSYSQAPSAPPASSYDQQAWVPTGPSADKPNFVPSSSYSSAPGPSSAPQGPPVQQALQQPGSPVQNTYNYYFTNGENAPPQNDPQPPAPPPSVIIAPPSPAPPPPPPPPQPIAIPSPSPSPTSYGSSYSNLYKPASNNPVASPSYSSSASSPTLQTGQASPSLSYSRASQNPATVGKSFNSISVNAANGFSNPSSGYGIQAQNPTFQNPSGYGSSLQSQPLLNNFQNPTSYVSAPQNPVSSYGTPLQSPSVVQNPSFSYGLLSPPVAQNPTSGYGQTFSAPVQSPPSSYGFASSAPALTAQSSLQSFPATIILHTGSSNTASFDASSSYSVPSQDFSSSYGVPLSPPSSSYGVPQSPPSSSYGVPQSPPSSSYGVPQSDPISNAPAPPFQTSQKDKQKGKPFKFLTKSKGNKGNQQQSNPPSSSYGYNSPPSSQPLRDPGSSINPMLNINYEYKYSGPPIIARGRKSMQKKFFKGAMMLGAMAALPIMPTVIFGRRKREADLDISNESLPQLTETPNFMNLREKRAFNETASNETTSLFDSLPFQGAPIPKDLRKELARYLPPMDALTDAECLQKSFCENLIELEETPFRDSFLFFYSALSPEADTNQWLQQSLTAARKNKCHEFYCTKPVNDDNDDEL